MKDSLKDYKASNLNIQQKKYLKHMKYNKKYQKDYLIQNFHIDLIDQYQVKSLKGTQLDQVQIILQEVH
jgi:hypothetical protein